jgi:hypothetical protein
VTVSGHLSPGHLACSPFKLAVQHQQYQDAYSSRWTMTLRGRFIRHQYARLIDVNMRRPRRVKMTLLQPLMRLRDTRRKTLGLCAHNARATQANVTETRSAESSTVHRTVRILIQSDLNAFLVPQLDDDVAKPGVKHGTTSYTSPQRSAFVKCSTSTADERRQGANVHLNASWNFSPERSKICIVQAAH